MTKPEKSVPLHADRDLRHPAGGRNVFHDDMMTYGHLRQDHSLAEALRVSFGVMA